MKQTIVIGNKFKRFALKTGIVTLNQYKALKCKLSDVVLGQGLSRTAIQAISSFTLDSTECIKQLAHKREQRNVLIANLIKISADKFLFDLFIDDSCAEMSDHQTGYHIQGMVLTEAARQMVIAVAEKFIIDNCQKGKMSFITHSTNSYFNGFIFPLPVKMQLTINDLKKTFNSNISAKVTIGFIQNDVTQVEINFHYSALESDFVHKKESLLAMKSIKNFLANMIG